MAMVEKKNSALASDCPTCGAKKQRPCVAGGKADYTFIPDDPNSFAMGLSFKVKVHAERLEKVGP